MATSRQVVQIVAQHLALPEGKLVWVADVLRAARLLPAAQGSPVDLSWREVALILLAAALGNPIANKPWRLSEWAEVADDTGAKLQDAIAWWLQHPEPLTRLTVSLTAPAATAIEERETPTVRQFGSSEGPERHAVLHGDVARAISKAINSAPAVRAGRPKTREIHYA